MRIITAAALNLIPIPIPLGYVYLQDRKEARRHTIHRLLALSPAVLSLWPLYAAWDAPGFEALAYAQVVVLLWGVAILASLGVAIKEAVGLITRINAKRRR